MCPRPIPDHQYANGRMYAQLLVRAPRELDLLQEVDLDLCLAPTDRPGTVRVPDIVVVTRAAFLRVRQEGGLLRAGEAVWAAEILSTGAKRTDRVISYHKYADAGIGHYWMVDVDDGPVTGRFVTDLPFPTTLDLRALG